MQGWRNNIVERYSRVCSRYLLKELILSFFAMEGEHWLLSIDVTTVYLIAVSLRFPLFFNK